jgi:hypothetical protein
MGNKEVIAGVTPRLAELGFMKRAGLLTRHLLPAT